MFPSKKVSRLIVTAVMTTAALGASASVSEASTQIAPAVGLGNCGWNFTQACTGEGYPVATGLSTVTIEFNCDVASTTGAQATSVYCYVHDISTGQNYFAPSLTEQGAVAGTAGAAINVPADRYQLCVGGGLTDLGGGVHGISNVICFTPIV